MQILKGGDQCEVRSRCVTCPCFAYLSRLCALQIGERGINLSGGQKARVSLARAAYANAEVVFADDPLAAVDAHVGEAIFDGCFLQLMRGKTRVLVTNQLAVLPRVDRIVVVDHGAIAQVGTYHELEHQEGVFRTLLETLGKEQHEGAWCPLVAGLVLLGIPSRIKFCNAVGAHLLVTDCPRVRSDEEADTDDEGVFEGDDDYLSEQDEIDAHSEVDPEGSILAGADAEIPRSRSGSLTIMRDRVASTASKARSGSRARTKSRARRGTRGRMSTVSAAQCVAGWWSARSLVASRIGCVCRVRRRSKASSRSRRSARRASWTPRHTSTTTMPWAAGLCVWLSWRSWRLRVAG